MLRDFLREQFTEPIPIFLADELPVCHKTEGGIFWIAELTNPGWRDGGWLHEEFLSCDGSS
ncbi:hypothetical protein D187_007065 [Cystobacter fuscus DSM 2262]|uniref:Uncharacterized protein n=1 Tax=Cystobacter fuscus (strain ATCC 25194 / DSM 2262 / NBRC 100088 / M29) TaxID=1242864 RepID=S9P2D7_CYSF2|nr:hypothetical protein [Cystobacter fuscus]EPX57311.1 hypothetical protein D187_007065 [Cystobacter fuscus DSM 2262]